MADHVFLTDAELADFEHAYPLASYQRLVAEIRAYRERADAVKAVIAARRASHHPGYAYTLMAAIDRMAEAWRPGVRGEAQV